jgi:hypothetical protein
MIAILIAHLPLLLSLAGGIGGLVALCLRFGTTAVLDWAARNRELVVLVAVAAVAAIFWRDATRARADRDRTAAWANAACAMTAHRFDTPVGKAAEACRVAIADLVAFKAETVAGTARVLRDHHDREIAKTAADAASARRDANRAQAALSHLEKTNAAIGPDDRIDGAWLRAFNDAAGLR